MYLFGVIGAAKCVSVALAAHQRDFARWQVAAGRGETRLQALELGRFGGEGDFQFRFACEAAHRSGDGTLKRLNRRFRLAHATSTLAALSGSSSPKLRW